MCRHDINLGSLHRKTHSHALLSRSSALLSWKVVMTKDAETLGQVSQNDYFNYQHCNNIMDSWAYTDHFLTKPQPSLGDNYSPNYMFYDRCKTPYQQGVAACSPADSMLSEPSEKTGSSPDLVYMEEIQNLVKSESIFSGYPQEALNLNSARSAFRPPNVHQNPLPLSSRADTYDKLVINNVFDSLLSQKWQAETVSHDTSSEVLPYSDPFPDQPCPVYIDSYNDSPPETFR
ncbi:uncharacterized protein LOC109614701 [Esox lucius]|uniref:uncharacterized protein LOC109614701 n=1 Tax=Esox lucius TaxID=8010 RepID=UPI00147778B3|nr:uncharacterized protein LOC109614701 [Esox lucius]